MANPLGSAPQNNNKALEDYLVNVIQFARGQSNPQTLIQQMIMQNPQAAQRLNQIQSLGQSPKDMVFNILKQQGINPEQIMKRLK